MHGREIETMEERHARTGICEANKHAYPPFGRCQSCRAQRAENALRALAEFPIVAGLSAAIRDGAAHMGVPDPLAAARAALAPAPPASGEETK